MFFEKMSDNSTQEISIPFSIQLSLMLQAEHLAVMLFGGANSHNGKNVGHVSLLTFGSLQKYPIRKFGQAATYSHMAMRYSCEGSVFYGTPCVDLQSLHYLNHTSCFTVEMNPLAKCGLNALKDYFVGSAPEMKRMLAHHIKAYKARYFEHFCNLEEKQLYPSYGFEERVVKKTDFRQDYFDCSHFERGDFSRNTKAKKQEPSFLVLKAGARELAYQINQDIIDCFLEELAGRRNRKVNINALKGDIVFSADFWRKNPAWIQTKYQVKDRLFQSWLIKLFEKSKWKSTRSLTGCNLIISHRNQR